MSDEECDLSDDEVRAGRSSLPDYLSQTEGNVGRVVSPPLPAPAVTTNINIITIRGTHAATMLLTQAYPSPALQCTMFSLNMRGLCHASVDTVYSGDQCCVIPLITDRNANYYSLEFINLYTLQSHNDI